MPTTVNGVGTHYYGKSERSTRTGTCTSCRQFGLLESYNTRLWFVIVYVPIIPLGRKRVIDECPRCRRHMVADAAKYEAARQQEIAGSLEHYRQNSTVEAAIQAHAQLVVFHAPEQAAELRREVLKRFPNDATLRLVLAEHLRQTSQFEEMASLREEALALAPDMPEARIVVALWRMTHGDLDGARSLLKFLEAPGAGAQYDLEPLFLLAKNLQAEGLHQDTLDLAAILIREKPDLGQQHDFRKLVLKSERFVPCMESLVPPVKHPLLGFFRADGSPYSQGTRKFVVVALLLILVGLGAVGSNYYIRTHRTIRVANACGSPVQVRIDQGPPSEVLDSATLPVAEGRHRIQLTGAVEETHDVEITSGFFERWTSSPLWILNPGGEAVIESRTITYAVNPVPEAHSLIVGKPFIAVPHVDYAFTEPPDSLTLKRKTQEITKVAVGRFVGTDNAAFLATDDTDRLGALNFAERRLRRNRDPGLLLSYINAVTPADKTRAEAFLKTGLTREPLSVYWHRAYQHVADRPDNYNNLVAEYDAFLAKAPTKAEWLYLRGRIEPELKRRAELFQQAATADPTSPWPWYGLAGVALNTGHWDEGLRDLHKTQELKLDDSHVPRAIHAARMALGEAETLATEYRQAINGNVLGDIQLLIQLFDALAASGHPESIEPELMAWENRLPNEIRMTANNFLRPFALYQAGRPEEAARQSQATYSSQAPSLVTEGLLAAGRTAEAAMNPKAANNKDPWTLLSIALGYMIDGEPDQAGPWQTKAVAALRSGDVDQRRVATALEIPEPMPVPMLEEIFLQPGEKALLFAFLAERFPAKRAEYHEVAARFNIVRLPPYLLIRRALEHNAQAKP